jgi:hypothetical protein
MGKIYLLNIISLNQVTHAFGGTSPFNNESASAILPRATRPSCFSRKKGTDLFITQPLTSVMPGTE